MGSRELKRQIAVLISDIEAVAAGMAAAGRRWTGWLRWSHWSSYLSAQGRAGGEGFGEVEGAGARAPAADCADVRGDTAAERAGRCGVKSIGRAVLTPERARFRKMSRPKARSPNTPQRAGWNHTGKVPKLLRKVRFAAAAPPVRGGVWTGRGFRQRH